METKGGSTAFIIISNCFSLCTVKQHITCHFGNKHFPQSLPAYRHGPFCAHFLPGTKYWLDPPPHTHTHKNACAHAHTHTQMHAHRLCLHTDMDTAVYNVTWNKIHSLQAWDLPPPPPPPHKHEHSSTQMHVHIHTHTQNKMKVHTHTHTRHACIHTHTHACTHAHTHTHTQKKTLAPTHMTR